MSFTPEKQKIIDDFHKLYYGSGMWRDGKVKWMGTSVLKCPFDLFVYQEILFKNKPDLIIETGTCYGGTTMFLANMLDIMGHSGKIVSIDVTKYSNRPTSPRITYLNGSSTKHHVLKDVRVMAKAADKIMVILDSSHSKSHVLKEMKRYGPLVSCGQYMIVEDTNINGYPVRPGWGPGPTEAVSDFLVGNDEFCIDSSLEKHLITFNPGGFLKKIKKTGFEIKKEQRLKANG